MFLHHYLISLIKSFYLFLLFRLLLNKIDYKQIFNITFINYYLFTNNYALKKVNLVFVEYKWSTIIKLKQLKLLNLKFFCIIKTIFFKIKLF